jgi:hypothetical protein
MTVLCIVDRLVDQRLLTKEWDVSQVLFWAGIQPGLEQWQMFGTMDNIDLFLLLLTCPHCCRSPCHCLSLRSDATFIGVLNLIYGLGLDSSIKEFAQNLLHGNPNWLAGYTVAGSLAKYRKRDQ